MSIGIIWINDFVVKLWTCRPSGTQVFWSLNPGFACAQPGLWGDIPAGIKEYWQAFKSCIRRRIGLICMKISHISYYSPVISRYGWFTTAPLCVEFLSRNGGVMMFIHWCIVLSSFVPCLITCMLFLFFFSSIVGADVDILGNGDGWHVAED